MKTPTGRATRNSRGSCPYRAAVRCAPMFRCQHCRHKIAWHQARFSLLLARKRLSSFYGRLVSLLDRETKLVCSLCDVRSSLTRTCAKLSLVDNTNNCHFRHVRRINNLKLSALPAAQRVPRERDYTEGAFVQMHQSVAAAQ